MARSDGGTAAMDGGCCSSPPHAAVLLRAGRAFLRSSARADAGNAATAAGTLLGMATMLAGVILATDRGKERANARLFLSQTELRKGCLPGTEPPTEGGVEWRSS